MYDGPHMGEIYDATKEIEGWSVAGFDDASWDNVKPAPHPGGELVSPNVPTYSCDQNISSNSYKEFKWRTMD